MLFTSDAVFAGVRNVTTWDDGNSLGQALGNELVHAVLPNMGEALVKGIAIDFGDEGLFIISESRTI